MHIIDVLFQVRLELFSDLPAPGKGLGFLFRASRLQDQGQTFVLTQFLLILWSHERLISRTFIDLACRVSAANEGI
ncbi:hypothetical protein CK498_13350 [Halomonas salipaludis]|uniref:Uncharacterized protein n=1 Tax=Halomonas salipaludis TaxID=2032625 RepID=A0A2A2ER31_9GAMM|nr:hypothetical protein CK498_13350 [Halomonas salipaludis]